MKHYGDITKLSGYDLPVVDIITGGSPCQDLSVAGKRAGLAGERSGLFMEQIRVVKEMRERDARDTGRTGFLVRPRFMVWENVPGAFSSNGGKDFQAVLEEIVGIVEADVPDLSGAVTGKWTKAGCLYDELGKWSVAWRVHDAQFWGVPQRRKRIALVADFGGLSAPEVLFERNGLSWDSEQGGAQRKGTAGGAERGIGISITPMSFQWQAGAAASLQMGIDVASTLNVTKAAGVFCGSERGAGRTICLQGNGIGRSDSNGCDGRGWRENQSYTLNTIDIPAVFENHSQDSRYKLLPFDTTQITSPQNGNNPHYGDPCHPLAAGAHAPAIVNTYQDVTGALTPGAHLGSYNGQDAYNDMLVTAPVVFDKEMYNCGEKMDGVPQARYDNVAPTVRADSHPSGVCTSTVRRLTPLECERLQGFPDNWTNIGEWTDSKGKKHKEADSPRYKALGNSIALPFWAWMARRICAQYERPMTMASLFDGIGGFPLVFSRAGATPVWASEIEEFPIAVTKLRFPEVEP